MFQTILLSEADALICIFQFFLKYQMIPTSNYHSQSTNQIKPGQNPFLSNKIKYKEEKFSLFNVHNFPCLFLAFMVSSCLQPSDTT